MWISSTPRSSANRRTTSHDRSEYSPISHVAMYLGGGQMVEAPHTGLTVRIVGVYWQYYVGAGRPG